MHSFCFGIVLLPDNFFNNVAQKLQNDKVYKFGMANSLQQCIWDYQNNLNFFNLGRIKEFAYVTTFELKDYETAQAMEKICLKIV